VVVHADVRDVRRHVFEGLFAAELQEGLVAGGVELEERHAELEALGPLGPAARRVFAGDGEDRGALGGVPGRVDGADLLAGEFEHAGGLLLELLRSEFGVDFHKNE
jgi:hypothetical protein